ncbi:kinase-like protein [Neolentinus lepideus HHB14362 ss-1]|uniref:Kinase-like protein n=1 Tax=Neolentinus lepideus HHB14362 ss-1 TaxID=1314782 RepID=A0A165RU66_9AGAM|nr:kinase-like protein [Neolentinus lepideus HHB14362 ss-1]
MMEDMYKPDLEDTRKALVHELSRLKYILCADDMQLWDTLKGAMARVGSCDQVWNVSLDICNLESLKIKYLVGPIKEQFHNFSDKDANNPDRSEALLAFEIAILNTLKYLHENVDAPDHEDQFGFKRAWRQCHPVPQMSAWATFIGYAEANFLYSLQARGTDRSDSTIERDALVVHLFLGDALAALHSNSGTCRTMKELLATPPPGHWLDAFHVVNPVNWDDLAVQTAITGQDAPEAVRFDGGAVKVGKYVVKKCRTYPLSEVLAMEFVRRNTTIPVPRVHAVRSDKNGSTTIVMDFIEGQVLEDLLRKETVDQEQQKKLAEQLYAFVQQLRSLGTRDAVGAWPIGPLGNLFFTPPPSVPLDNLDKLYSYFVEKYEYGQGRRRPPLPQFKFHTQERYPFVLSHGDLNTRNIIVQESQGFPGQLEIAGIVDWETFGWYPEFWEGMMATFAVFSAKSWRDLIKAELGSSTQACQKFLWIIMLLSQIENGIS